MQDAQSALVGTADQDLSGKKVIALKQLCDDAMAQCSFIKACLVSSRTGAEVNMQKGENNIGGYYIERRDFKVCALTCCIALAIMDPQKGAMLDLDVGRIEVRPADESEGVSPADEIEGTRRPECSCPPGQNESEGVRPADESEGVRPADESEVQEGHNV